MRFNVVLFDSLQRSVASTLHWGISLQGTKPHLTFFLERNNFHKKDFLFIKKDTLGPQKHGSMEMEQKCCPILLMSKKVKAIVPRISKPSAFLLQRAIVPLEATPYQNSEALYNSNNKLLMAIQIPHHIFSIISFLTME